MQRREFIQRAPHSLIKCMLAMQTATSGERNKFYQSWAVAFIFSVDAHQPNENEQNEKREKQKTFEIYSSHDEYV